jgi:hypothetical protein
MPPPANSPTRLDRRREPSAVLDPPATKFVVRCDEHPRDVAFVVLASTTLEPVIEIGLPARELFSIVTLIQGRDSKPHEPVSPLGRGAAEGRPPACRQVQADQVRRREKRPDQRR